MTKSYEKGENEVSEEAKREALRTGEDVRVILQRMMRAAQAANDRVRKQKIVRAEKYFRQRNKQKRGGS